MTRNIPLTTMFVLVIFQWGGFCGGNWPLCGGECVEKMCVTENKKNM